MEFLSEHVIQYEYRKLRNKLIREGASDADLERITPEMVEEMIINRAISEGYAKGIRDHTAKQVAKTIGKKYHYPTHPGLIKVKELGYPPIGRWMWITINTMEGISVIHLLKCINNFTKKHNCLAWYYNIEQRSRELENLGKGIHSHMLIKNAFPYKSVFRNALEESFKNVCEAENRNILNQKVCLPEHIKYRMNYINGDKKDKGDKLQMCVMDNYWRAKEGLQHYYKSDNWENVTDYILADSNQSSDTDSDSE